MDLFHEIKPAQALGIRVHHVESGRIELVAPFAPNRNDKGTAFAGSMASMLSLAGWGVITQSLRDAGIEADVMIVKSEIEYTAPARSALFAEAELSDHEIARISQELDVRGRSRIGLQADLHSDDVPCASMTADYAIVRTQPDQPAV